MNTPLAFRSQYLAALATTRQAIEKCPPELWDDPARSPNRFWRVAYHSLFYTHLYLQPRLEDFKAWEKHRSGDERFDDSQPSHVPTKPVEPFTPADLLEYTAFCQGVVEDILPTLDLDGPSGFHWLDMTKLEHLIYNLRHLEQHNGELLDRLGKVGIDVAWVSLIK